MRALRHALVSLLLLVWGAAGLYAANIGGGVSVSPGGADPAGAFTRCSNALPFLKANNNVLDCAADPGAGTGAPTGAKYITQTPDGTLSAEQALSALSTGLVLNTTTTGVLSIYGGASCTNQFPRSSNASGGWTCASIQISDLAFDPATQAELDAVSNTLTAHSSATTNVHGISNTANLVLKDGSVSMDKVPITDTDATPIANRQLQVKDGLIQSATTAGVEGRYIKNTSLEPIDSNAIANDAVTAAKVQFNFIAGLIAGTNITIDNCTPGEGIICTINAAAGGGGSSNEHTAALLSTSGLGNITLSGEQTIDGTLTSASRVLVTNQTNATQNGTYTTAAGAWTRTTDADAGAEFTGNWNIFVLSGTRNAGQRCTLTNTGTVTLGSTNITFSCDPGGNGLSVSDYDTTTGVPRLSGGKIKPGELVSYAQHADLIAANSITVTARTMGLQGSGGPVTLSSNPQISFSGVVPNQVVEFEGLSDTATVTLTQGNGVGLCGGNVGSTLVIGKKRSKPAFKLNLAGNEYVQIGCPSLQDAFNVWNEIVTTAARPLKLTDAAGTSYHSLFVDSATPKQNGTCNGGGCPYEVDLAAGLDYIVRNSLGVEVFRIAESTGNFIMGAGTLNDISVRVLRSANQSIPDNVQTDIAWDNEDYDTASMHDNVTNNTRITIPKAGKYLITCLAEFVTNQATASSTIRVNGTTTISDIGTQMHHSLVYNFAANDYFQMRVFQNSGAAVDLSRLAGRTPWCTAQKVN